MCGCACSPRLVSDRWSPLTDPQVLGCGRVWIWGVVGTHWASSILTHWYSCLTSLFRLWAGPAACLPPVTGHHPCDVTLVGTGLWGAP